MPPGPAVVAPPRPCVGHRSVHSHIIRDTRQAFALSLRVVSLLRRVVFTPCLPATGTTIKVIRPRYLYHVLTATLGIPLALVPPPSRVPPPRRPPAQGALRFIRNCFSCRQVSNTSPTRDAAAAAARAATAVRRMLMGELCS